VILIKQSNLWTETVPDSRCFEIISSWAIESNLMTVPALCLLHLVCTIALCVCDGYSAEAADDQAEDNSANSNTSDDEGDIDQVGFLSRATNESAEQRRNCHCVDSANGVVATTVNCRKMHLGFSRRWLVVVVNSRSGHGMWHYRSALQKWEILTSKLRLGR
jgi:hypothetical protein